MSWGCQSCASAWEVNFKIKTKNQQNGAGIIAFLLIYLSQRKILLNPTDSPLCFSFFQPFGRPWQLKMQTGCPKEALGCSLQAEICRMGTPSTPWLHPTPRDLSKLPSPSEHLPALSCSYQDFPRGISDVSFWSPCEKEKSFYFKAPLERRRLTRAEWSFHSFV